MISSSVLILFSFISLGLGILLGWILARSRSVADQERVKFLQQRLDDQKAETVELQERFRVEFENIANRLLEEKSEKFTKQNSERLGEILTPFTQKIEEFKKQVQEVYKEENNQRVSLQGQLKEMIQMNKVIGEQAENLTKALKIDTKQQGNWGEVVLQRILERSGLREGHEYVTQSSHTTEEGRRLQPDVVLHLPDQKYLIIDSKVVLTAYERFHSEENEAQKGRHLKDHVTAIRTHVRSLSKKNYETLYQDKSPDFILMFIPIESAYSLALQSDIDLYSDSFASSIIIVSPTTLMATLATIETIWRQERQNRYAVEIADRGARLLEKFTGFIDSLQEIGDRLDQARKSYDMAFDRLRTGRGNLISQAVKLQELGVKVKKDLPESVLEGAELESTGEEVLHSVNKIRE